MHEDSSVSIVADIMSNRSCIGKAGKQNSPAVARGRGPEGNGEGYAMDWQAESSRADAGDARDQDGPAEAGHPETGGWGVEEDSDVHMVDADSLRSEPEPSWRPARADNARDRAGLADTGSQRIEDSDVHMVDADLLRCEPEPSSPRARPTYAADQVGPKNLGDDSGRATDNTPGDPGLGHYMERLLQVADRCDTTNIRLIAEICCLTAVLPPLRSGARRFEASRWDNEASASSRFIMTMMHALLQVEATGHQLAILASVREELSRVGHTPGLRDEVMRIMALMSP